MLSKEIFVPAVIMSPSSLSVIEGMNCSLPFPPTPDSPSPSSSIRRLHGGYVLLHDTCSYITSCRHTVICYYTIFYYLSRHDSSSSDNSLLLTVIWCWRVQVCPNEANFDVMFAQIIHLSLSSHNIVILHLIKQSAILSSSFSLSLSLTNIKESGKRFCFWMVWVFKTIKSFLCNK